MPVWEVEMSRMDDLAHDVTVLILGGGRGARLNLLTRLRSKPAVPVAGRYRLIDIPISNAINSHMERMYVLTQFNSVSLHRHIGRTYRFDAFSRGYVQILAAQQTPTENKWFEGTADAVRRYQSVFKDVRGKFVLILAGDHMYRMDYRELLQEHVESKADITVGVLPCTEEEIGGFGAARIDESGKIIEFREKPSSAEQRDGMKASKALLERRNIPENKPYLASMGIYMFSGPALVAALDNSLNDFGRDIIPSMLDRFHVQSHFFNGYWRDIGTIHSFFEAHMDLVKPDPPFTFHDQNWPFYTRPRYLPGAQLKQCHFDRVILAEGTNIESCTVEDSIIGLRSVIRGATVRRTLLMGIDAHYPEAGPGDPEAGIGEGSEICNAIIDKNARIGRNVRIINQKKLRDAEYDSWAIRDGVVVVPKNSVIPDGTVI
jgi:glucose-1-phosphate adenylyltransferase